MIRHAALALLAALAMEAPAAVRRHDEPVTVPSDPGIADCRTGTLQHYPRYLNRGLSLTIGLRARGDPDADYAALDRLLAGFGRVRFVVNDDTVIALTSPTVAGREAVDRLLRQACQVEEVSPFRLSGVRTVDSRQSRRAAARSQARERARQRYWRALERRRIAEAEAERRRRLRAPPTPEELTPLLRAHWLELPEQLPGQLHRGQFSRVRDARCRLRQGHFHCRVGVLGTSARGPEYEQVHLTFSRQRDGSLVLDLLLDIPIN